QVHLAIRRVVEAGEPCVRHNRDDAKRLRLYLKRLPEPALARPVLTRHANAQDGSIRISLEFSRCWQLSFDGADAERCEEVAADQNRLFPDRGCAVGPLEAVVEMTRREELEA